MTDLDRAILDAWARIRPHLLANPDQLLSRLSRRRSTMLRRPMRHWCIALRASDRRINAFHWPITPDHAMQLNHPDHPYEPIEHEVLIQTPQLRKFYSAIPLEDWEEPVDLARKMGCSPSNLTRARQRGFYSERKIPLLGGKRGKPVPLLHYKRPLSPSGTHFFEPPNPILGGAWQWLPDLLPDDFEQAVMRTPVFHRQGFSRSGTLARLDIPDDHLYKDECRLIGYRWICPGCQKHVRKIYYPLAMPLISGFLDPDPALELIRHIPEPDQLFDFPPTFACAKCHRIQYFAPTHEFGWNNLIAHLTAGLLFGHEVAKPSWYKTGHRKRAALRQLHRPAPRREMVLRRLLLGYSNPRIRREMMITKGALDSHILNLCRQHDVPDRHALVAKLGGAASPPLNQHERAAQRRFQVQTLLLEGLPLKEMMSRLNLDRPTLMRDVSAIYRHHDIKPGNRGPNSSRRALAAILGITLPPIGAARLTVQAQALHASGLPIPQIAAKLHRCEAVIRRHLKRLPASPSSPLPLPVGAGHAPALAAEFLTSLRVVESAGGDRGVRVRRVH